MLHRRLPLLARALSRHVLHQGRVPPCRARPLGQVPGGALGTELNKSRTLHTTFQPQGPTGPGMPHLDPSKYPQAARLMGSREFVGAATMLAQTVQRKGLLPSPGEKPSMTLMGRWMMDGEVRSSLVQVQSTIQTLGVDVQALMRELEQLMPQAQAYFLNAPSTSTPPGEMTSKPPSVEGPTPSSSSAFGLLGQFFGKK